MKWYSITDWIAGTIVTLGGLNLGLVGWFNYDLIAKLFSDGSTWYRVVLAVIGLAAVYMISFLFRTSAETQMAHA